MLKTNIGKTFAIVWGAVLLFLSWDYFSFFYWFRRVKLGFMPTFEELEIPNNKIARRFYSEDGEDYRNCNFEGM